MNPQTDVATKATTLPPQIVAPVGPNLLQRKCACGGTPRLDGECAECRSKRLSSQRTSSYQSEPSSVSPIVYEVLRSSGQPLDPTTRAFIEPRFGHHFKHVRVHSVPPVTHSNLTVGQTDNAHEQEADRMSDAVLRGQTSIMLSSSVFEPSNSTSSIGADFGHVRIHTDTRAAESARAVNARAYTVGNDVVFGHGQYAPATTVGKRLLAHELVHTLQHTGQVARQPEAPETPEVEVGFAAPGLQLRTIPQVGPTIGERISARRISAETLAPILARRMREAFRGIGTDEDEVYLILSYPPDQVREMINYYNDNLNDHTGMGLVEDIKDEFSGSELDEAMRLLANAKIAEHTSERTTQIESTVPGEPGKLWAGLIVRGMWSKEHEPGVMEQHADVVIPDASGAMRTRGYFGEQAGATGSSAEAGLGLPGISADFEWFLANRPYYVDLELAKLMSFRSSLILIKVTKEQAAELDQYWEDLKSDPGTFYILGRNCSTAAAAGFEEAHLTKEIGGLDTPDNLFQQLRKRYRDAFMISGFYGYTRPGRSWELVGGRPILRHPGTGSWAGPFVVERRLA